MAIKKYNDFPDGTYDTSKIFLQADPVTGALEKVNLPEPGAVNKFTRLAAFRSPAAATTNSFTNLYNYTIPANQLATNGDAVNIKLAGYSNQDSSFAQIKFSIPGLDDTTTLNIALSTVTIDMQLIRSSGTGGSMLLTKWDSENGTTIIWNDVFSIDFTADIDIDITGLVDTSGSMVAQSMTIDFITL